jgi:L-ascorbate metabolism protein UlaG (beta-lactamase superfamily)
VGHLAALIPSRPLAVLAVALALAGCAGVGGPVPGAPAHHRQDGFANTNPDYARAGRAARMRYFVSRMLASTFSPARADFPRVDNDGRALAANRGEPTVTWVGHSTLLVQLDGVNVLTDPQWSERASPVSFAGPRRLTPPGLDFDRLPPIHLVVISHDHYDHLDVRTVRRLAERHHPRFLVPLGFRAWFAALGIHDVQELDWWGSRVEHGLTFTCVPAQHFSGRTLLDQNRRLSSGWTIAGAARRLYYSGDTAYYAPYFTEIGARLGPFDLAAVAIGAYLPPHIMKASHADPVEALRIARDVRAARVLGVHWGTFDLADEPPDDPPRRFEAEARRLALPPERVWVLRHGETRAW